MRLSRKEHAKMMWERKHGGKRRNKKNGKKLPKPKEEFMDLAEFDQMWNVEEPRSEESEM